MIGARTRLTTQCRHEDDEEDDGLDGRAQQLCLTDRSVFMRFGQFGLGQGGDENGSDSHRTEPTSESGLSERLDVGDPSISGEHEWQASKQEDGNGQEEEPPHGDLGRDMKWSAGGKLRTRHLTHGCRSVVPIRERNDHPDIDETSTVEQQIDNVGKHAILGGLVEESAASVEIWSVNMPRWCTARCYTYSQAKALPQANAASRSSLPSRVQTPLCIGIVRPRAITSYPRTPALTDG